MSFASKRYGKGNSSQIVVPESNLILGCNLLPDGDQILDVSGNAEHMTTIRGGASRRSVLGYAHDFYRPGENYIRNLSFGQGPTNDRITVTCWAKSASDTTQGLITKGQSGVSYGDFDLYLSSEELRFALNNNAISVGNGIDSVLDNNAWHFCVGRYDGTTLSVWVDGHLVASSAYAGGIDDDYDDVFFGLGYPGAVASYLYGSMVAPRIYNEAKSDEWIAREYARGAKAVQFCSDWGARISTDAEGGTLFQQIGNTPIIAANTIGRFFVDTDIINGSIVKTIRSTVAGSIEISTEHFSGSPGDAAYGTWDFWVKSDGTDDSIDIRFISDQNADSVVNPNEYSVLFAKNTRNVKLSRDDTGAIPTELATTVNDYWSANTWYHVHITRRYDGLFNVYINDVLALSATDNTHKESLWVHLPGEVGNEFSLGSRDGNFCINKRLGVV